MPDGDSRQIDAPSVPHRGIGFVEFVAMISATMAMNALATDIMLPGLAEIGSSLGVGDENERQWIVTAFLLGFGGAQVVYGPLSDRYGRRPLLLVGVAFYVVFNLAAAVAPSFGVLLAARVLTGVAIASGRVVVISVVRDCYGGREMARVMSLALLVMLAVPILAPSLGQAIMLAYSWRGTFWGLALFGAVVTVWMLFRLPETLHPEYRREISLPSILDATRRTLTDRQSVGYMLAQTLLFGGLVSFINSMPQIFADVFHAPKLMPIMFAAIGLSLAAASLVNARIVVRVGMRLLSHSALFGFIALSAIHLAVAAWIGETMIGFVVFQAATMACFVLAASNFGALSMEFLGEVAGTAASIQGFISTVVGALIGFVIGQSFNGTTLPMVAGFLTAGLAALTVVLITEKFILFRRHPL